MTVPSAGDNDDDNGRGDRFMSNVRSRSKRYC